MNFSVIKGDGYVKNLFDKPGIPEDGQVSGFKWYARGESPWHDHNVHEITAVIDGAIKEIRLVGGLYVEKIYTRGDVFEVPAGTVHKIIAIVGSYTLNLCYGSLEMKTFAAEDLPKGSISL